MSVLLAAGTSGTHTTLPVQAVKQKLYVKTKTIHIIKGKSVTFVFPGAKQKITWSVRNRGCVKIIKRTKKSLRLKAVKTGKVVVTATFGKKKRKCILRILPKSIESLAKDAAAATSTTGSPGVQQEAPATTPKQPETTQNQAETTKAPAATPEQTTKAPVATTEKPVQTDAPATTQGQAVTTKAPVTTEKPVQTDAPVTTQGQAVTTKAPATTEKPAQTDVLATTQGQAVTTKAPATTEKPAQTDALATTQSAAQTATTGSIATTEERSWIEVAGLVTQEDLQNREASQADIPSSFTFPENTGEGTFYGGGYSGGCCCLDSMTNGYYVCALNKPDYNTSQMAGAFIEVTGPIGKVKMLVADELPEGKKGDVDFNEIAFPLVAKVEDGRVPISWKIVPFPTDEPIKYWLKKDSSRYWMQLQVRNQRYPIAKVEMLQPDGTFVELKKENYNFFTVYMPGDGPFVFRVTDINGQVLTDTIPLEPGTLTDGKANFPY